MSSLMKLLIGTIALSSGITALSVPKPLQYRTYTDTFDNETAVAGVTATPAGYQNNINYNNFSLSSPVLPLSLAALMPASQPNFATFSARGSVPSGSVLNPTATAIKSAAIRYFSLVELYVGCGTASDETVADNAVGCGLVITGYDVNGKMTGEAPVNYAPTRLVNAPLTRVVLPQPQFAALGSFTIGIATSSILTPATFAAIDNITHVNYY